jgi:2-phospho-L-lactate/phosphoenolpyruvate guanylyltransferase
LTFDQFGLETLLVSEGVPKDFLGNLTKTFSQLSCTLGTAFLVPKLVVYAIVPVKRLDVSKRRLSKFLSPQERKVLTIAMLEDVLRALKSSTVSEIVIVSNDQNVRLIAERFGVYFLSPNHYGLNAAVEEAFDWCLRNQADSVLVVPADIPLLSFTDVNDIVELGTCNKPAVVLSPSNNGGTNALFQKPPNLLSAQFGYKSFARHFRQARSKGITIKFHYSTSIALDVDCEEDLQELFKSPVVNCYKHFLEEAGFESNDSKKA